LNEFDYVSMARLIDRGVKIGTIATALEAHGVWRWDEFGRFKNFGRESEPCQAALRRLARLYAQINSPYDEDSSGIGDPEGDPLYECFVALDKVSAEASEPKVEKPARPQSISRSGNATLRLVAALKRLCLGQLSDHRHPDCPDEEALIRIIEDHSAGRDGLKRVTVQKKFRESDEVWDVI
jgi:hypothetical protein